MREIEMDLGGDLSSEPGVLFQVRLPGGALLRLVREEDDMLTIQQAGRVLPGCYWRDDEVDRAIQEFRLISRRFLSPS